MANNVVPQMMSKMAYVVGPPMEDVGCGAVVHAVNDKALLGCLKGSRSYDGSCVCQGEVGQKPKGTTSQR